MLVLFVVGLIHLAHNLGEDKVRFLQSNGLSDRTLRLLIASETVASDAWAEDRTNRSATPMDVLFFNIGVAWAGRYHSDIGFPEDHRGRRANPFDNFPLVSYDNASTRQAKRPSL
jgi:hypothetical protein